MPHPGLEALQPRPTGSGASRHREYEPARSSGICSSRSPAVGVSVRSRDPLRWLVRLSVRWCGAALVPAVSPASIRARGRCSWRYERAPARASWVPRWRHRWTPHLER
jgi:hypothetical protein